MDSLKISDGKQELLEDMYYIQTTLGINGDKGYTISISLGNLYFDKEVFDKALACYQTSLRALQTGNGKKYRFDIASNNNTNDFLSDHPSDAKRIAALQQEMPEALKYYQKFSV